MTYQDQTEEGDYIPTAGLASCGLFAAKRRRLYFINLQGQQFTMEFLYPLSKREHVLPWQGREGNFL